MEPWLEIFFMLWSVVFPILGLLTPPAFLLFWRVVVPKVARKLAWARFGKANILAMADDSGWVELVISRKSLGEGVLETPMGWRLLPRPYWTKIKKALRRKGKKKEQTPEDLKLAENVVLRKFTLNGLGKPFWFGYSGKAPLMSPKALATLQETKDNPVKEHKLDYITQLKQYIAEELPKEYAKGMSKIINQLAEVIQARNVTLIDPTLIKEVVAKTYNQSQLDALATNREMRGMLRARRQFLPIILAIGLILGILALVVIVMVLK